MITIYTGGSKVLIVFSNNFTDVNILKYALLPVTLCPKWSNQQ